MAGQQQSFQKVFITDTTVPFLPYGSQPNLVICNECVQQVLTETKATPGFITYCISCLLCLICPLCAFIPCCFDDCQDIEHYCPNCKKLLSTYNR